MPDILTQASVLETVQSISTDQVKNPTQPVEVFIQEAENLLNWSTPHKELLMASGLNPYYFDVFPFAVVICREAQAKWFSEQKTKSDALKAWNEQSPAAYALRDQLLADFRFAFRKDETLLKSVALIAEGSSNADMIQDLADLAALGTINPLPLASINFDAQKLVLASSLSNSLAIVLAASNGDKTSENATLLFRNKAYTFLNDAASEIRATGRYVFRLKKSELKGYKSDYARKKYLKQLTKKKVANETV